MCASRSFLIYCIPTLCNLHNSLASHLCILRNLQLQVNFSDYYRNLSLTMSPYLVYIVCAIKNCKVISENYTIGGEKMVNLKEKREANGMSQQQLADAVGISRQAISNIEIGTAKPDVKHAIIIGRVLDFNWVLFYDDENSG